MLRVAWTLKAPIAQGASDRREGEIKGGAVPGVVSDEAQIRCVLVPPDSFIVNECGFLGFRSDFEAFKSRLFLSSSFPSVAQLSLGLLGKEARLEELEKNPALACV